MLKDVNRNPRRWVDGSGRVLVIEGWHPSAPSSISFNVLVDGDWIGSFSTLEAAAAAAGVGTGTGAGTVELQLEGPDPGDGGAPPLRLVPPPSDDS